MAAEIKKIISNGFLCDPTTGNVINLENELISINQYTSEEVKGPVDLSYLKKPDTFFDPEYNNS